MNPVQEKVMDVINKAGENVSLWYLHVIEEMFMMVMYLTPYGKNNDQVEYMHKNTTTWETPIRAGGVQQN